MRPNHIFSLEWDYQIYLENLSLNLSYLVGEIMHLSKVGENIIATTNIQLIKVPSNHSNFQYCDSNIGLFLLNIVKLSLLISLHPFLYQFFASFLMAPPLKLSLLKAIAIANAFKSVKERQLSQYWKKFPFLEGNKNYFAL